MQTRNDDTQTDASQETASEGQKDSDDNITHRSDEYLTPYMRAVKDYRSSTSTQSFVDFLDRMNILPSSDRPLTLDVSSETGSPLMCNTAVQKSCPYRAMTIHDFDNIVDERLLCDHLVDTSDSFDKVK